MEKYNTRTRKFLFNLELVKGPTHSNKYIVIHKFAHFNWATPQ